ncbi:MAG TPA: PAS domain S-box protein [Gemmatimonadales bacterium]|nr:PAS domain S-box protein [Gemmatimonadales bacterium]
MAENPLRILILEDVPMDAELMEYELERASIPFLSRRVDSREAFLDELDQFRPDLILSDYTLPRFDGMTALSLARERAPSIPFLIVTGSVNEETAVGCMKAGATDYLLKSNLARIGPAIEAALQRERAHAEKIQAESALAASERRFRSLVQNSSDLVTVLAPDGTITYASDSAERIVGYSPADLVGTSLLGYLDSNHVEPVRGLLHTNGKSSVAGPIEFSLRRPDGSVVWLEAVGSNLLTDATIRGIVLNARDVSERKRADLALRESEERYRDLFDNATDLVCMAAPDGSLLYVNKAWQQGTGYDDDEIDRMQLLDIVHPDSRGYYTEVVDRVLRGERLDHVELVFMPKTGAPITVEGNLSCTFRDGVPSAVRGIYRDVTERKRVEEQLRRAERMQAAGKLAGGVAHEVNNMMTGVIGFSEFVLRSLEPDDPRKADVEEVIKAGTRAADVTRQLLAFTRQQVLRPQMVQINAVVSDMEKMLRRSLGEDKLLELRLSPDAGEIRADRGQLEQVLINLVLNARDAMTGHGRVSIETALAVWDEVYAQRHEGVDIPLGRYVLLAVSDNGCGMDPQVQERIFEPFFTTKPIGQGTGLGLSTVYGIVKQSGGYVWVYSEPGEGSAFKVYLPQARVASEPDEPATEPDEPATEPVTASGRGSETVLVIEDESVVRKLACRGLRDHGYNVVEAANGAQALHYIREHPQTIDLVISDVVMPEIGGRELGQRLATLDPDLPILYMSGYTGEDVVQRGLLDPGAPFQQKPFTPAGLALKARQMLDQDPRRKATAHSP